MYETFMTVLRAFFGRGLFLTALKFAVPVVLIALLLWASPAFRALCRSWRERGGWRGVAVAVPSAFVKALIVFILMRLIIVAMVYQAQQFEFKHGNVTDANRSAVLMKWGYPHEQREPAVTFTAQRTWVTRQLLIPGDKDTGEKDTVTTDGFWKDDNVPVQAVEGVLPRIISTREEQKEVAVEQKGIDEADIQVDVTCDQRQLGGANYTGYRDVWDMRYVVVNRADKPVKAHVHFPLPSKTGNFNNMSLAVDDRSVAERATTGEDGIRWSFPMEPGQKSAVRICYESRGLDYLRYIPRRMTQTGHYLVTAVVHKADPKRMDWCYGSMPAEQKLDEVKGDPVRLTWTLDNALTSYDIGFKMPEALQPNYHVARLLNEAPIGLILLLLIFVAPRLILGKPVELSVLGLISAAYYLLYTFMGQLADVLPSFTASFIVAALVLTAIIAFLRWRGRSSRLLTWQDTLAFVGLSVLYPLAIVDADRTAFYMQGFYLAILLYTCVLLVRFRIGPSLAGKGEPAGE